MKRMNLGCGYDIKDGWLNTNYFSHLPVEGAIYFDALDKHQDMVNKFDFILINHVLCTMRPDVVRALLDNVLSWLKPGGKAEVIDMDLLKVFKSYEDGRIEDIPIEQGDIDDRLCLAISGYGTRNSLYTPKRMLKVLEEVGFKTIVEMDYSEYDTRPKESLIFEATK